MRLRIAVALLALACFTTSATAAEDPGAVAARGAAQRFGDALTGADTSLLKTLLPRKGKVQLRLVHLGPQEGFFSASQVEALLRDFLDQGAVRAFRSLGVEHEPGGVALVRARIELTDKAGRHVTAELYLAFQPEDGRWALREIRETPT